MREKRPNRGERRKGGGEGRGGQEGCGRKTPAEGAARPRVRGEKMKPWSEA